MVKALTPLFSLTFDSEIWQIKADILGKSLGIQLRESEELKSHLFQLALEDFNLSQRVDPEEPWWFNLEGVKGNHYLIHEYPDQEDPGKTDFKMIQSQTGTTAFKEPHARFSGFTDNQHIIFQKLTDQRFYQMINDERPEQIDNIHWIGNNWVQYPFQYLEEDKDFDILRELLLRTVQSEPVLGIEYMEYKSMIFLSYLIKEADLYSNYFLGLNGAGESLLFVKINEKMSGLGRDSFFTFADKLICIENKQVLHIYGL